MLQYLIRCIFFALGVALILDVVLPIRTEQLRVDQHTSRTPIDNRTTRSGDSTWADTHYTIHLIGGALSSCSVGHAVYGKLNDGDAVEVQSTQLFKTCTRIKRGQELIDHYKYWRWFALLGGVILIATALGWIKADDDEGIGGLGIRWG